MKLASKLGCDVLTASRSFLPVLCFGGGGQPVAKFTPEMCFIVLVIEESGTWFRSQLATGYSEKLPSFTHFFQGNYFKCAIISTYSFISVTLYRYLLSFNLSNDVVSIPKVFYVELHRKVIVSK